MIHEKLWALTEPVGGDDDRLSNVIILCGSCDFSDLKSSYPQAAPQLDRAVRGNWLHRLGKPKPAATGPLRTNGSRLPTLQEVLALQRASQNDGSKKHARALGEKVATVLPIVD